MVLRRWFREQMLGDDAEGDDVPPRRALVGTVLGRQGDRLPTLGEYDSSTFPAELREQLERREEVARALHRIDATDPTSRVAAIPQLQRMLRRYPHPLVYETLIHAYLDAGRYEEAKGVAFATKQRRAECAESPHPEVQAEISTLRAWDPEDIDALEAESSAGSLPRPAIHPRLRG